MSDENMANDHRKFPIFLELHINRLTVGQIQNLISKNKGVQFEKLVQEVHVNMPKKLVLRVFLLPSSDILTADIQIDEHIQNSIMNIDSLLGGLFDKNSLELNGLMPNSKIS